MPLRKRANSDPDPKDEKLRPIRIAVLGANGVGKSSIILQFLYKVFNEEYIETIEDLYRKQLDIFDQNVTLDILDTAGHSNFHSMRNLALSVSDAFVLVYSTTDIRSFNEVKNLRDEILSKRSGVPIIIVENKSDVESELGMLERKTIEATVRIDWGCGFVQVSAKNNTNIEQIFQEIVRLTTVINQNKTSTGHSRRFFSLGSKKTVHKDKKKGCTVS